MNYSSDINSRVNPDGLQEIRAWASRSPESARPGFRTRHRAPGPRISPRLVGAVLLALLVVLFSLAGYRYFQNGPSTPGLAVVPEPEQAASSAPVPAPPSSDPAEAPSITRDEARSTGEAPLPADALADSPEARKEPVQVTRVARAATPPSSRPAPRPSQGAPAVEREPARQKPEVSRIVMRRNDFESEPAVLLAEPAAEYPDAARGTGTSAKIIVGFTIDETGAVRNPVIERIQIQGDAPKAPFEQAALAAARRARFTPAQERGVPTRSWNTLTFSFEAGLPPV